MFEMGLLGPIRRLHAAFPDVIVLGYFDNVALSCSDPARAVAASEFLDAEAAKVGLVVRHPKSAFLWMNDNPLPEPAAEFCRAKGIPVEREAAIVLGAPVGRNEGKIKELLHEAVTRHDRFFNLLGDERLPVQQSMLLLSRSGVPRFSYLARCVRPALMIEAARAFDARVRDTACAKLRIPSTDRTQMARKQICLPVRLGGWGLRPAEHTLHFAFYGAIAAASRRLLGLFPVERPQPEMLRQAIAASWHHIDTLLNPRGKSPVPFLPDKARNTLPFFKNNLDMAFAKKLQHTLTATWEQGVFNALQRESGSQADYRRLGSLAEKMAGAWVAVIPCAASLVIPDRLYRIAALLRLGLEPCADMPKRCACGVSLDGNWLHLTWCSKFFPNRVIFRHNQLVECVDRAVRRVGGSTRVEPANLRHAADDRRPDIDVLLGLDRLLVDASIRLPDAEPLEATRVASKEKHQHYAAQAASLHARVVPFIVETYGAWGDEAVEFAKQLRDHLVAAVKPVNPSEFYYHFCSEASVAVQRGNALVLESALQAARNSEQFAVRWPRSVVQVPGSLRIHVDAP